MNNLTIINQDGKLLINSRQVADMVDKDHAHLMRDIRGYVETLRKSTNPNLDSLNFFIESTYEDAKGEIRPCYLLTKQGCEMVANKMTGEKGILFTAAYVSKFNEMEKQQTTLPQMTQTQIIAAIAQAAAEQEIAIKQLSAAHAQHEAQLQGIRDVVALNPNDWRKDSGRLIAKMAQKLGGNEHIQDLRKESYQLLNERFGVNLKQRLTNKRQRMADEGASRSKRDSLSYLDVIADDKKLIEGYVAIVKEMAIKYGA